jgi:hypothetical protein
MRISLRTSGGVGYFPGLAAPRTVDVDALGDDELRAVRQLVDDARFFELPARPPTLKGAADYRTYEITIEDGARRHTAVLADPIVEPALQELVERLRALTVARSSG